MYIKLKAKKVKLYSTLKNLIASLAIMLTCNSFLGEIIQGDNPDSIYVCAYDTPSSKSSQSKRIAKEKAELSAMQEFVIYAVKENLILPESLEYLSEKIKDAIIVSSLKGKVEGATVLRSMFLNDGRAVCVVEIPKANLKNFKTLDFTNNTNDILKKIYNPRLLRIEMALTLELEDILTFSSKPLSRAIEGKKLNGIAKAWVEDIDVSEETLSNMTDNEILNTLEHLLGLEEEEKLLLTEIEKRYYTKSSKFLAGHKIPTKEVLIEDINFLEDINLAELSKLSRIIAENNFSIDFSNEDIANEKFDEAQAEFSGEKSDFLKIKNLLIDSLIENVTDDAMNLLGRCFEEEGNFKEALIYYFQTFSINEKQPYVKYNIAKSLYKLRMENEALHWAKESINDDSTSAWAKTKAQELIVEIEKSKVLEDS